MRRSAFGFCFSFQNFNISLTYRITLSLHLPDIVTLFFDKQIYK